MSQASFSSNTTHRVARIGSLALLLSSTLMGGAAQAADVVVPTDNGGSSTTSTPAPTNSTTTTSAENSTVPTTTTIPLNGTRFICQSNGGIPTVMYQPESQPNQAFPWAVPGTMGGGWTPEARCREIANRLESYRPDGLVEMGTAVQNGYNTICVTTERVPGCRIVLTVPQGQDPTATRDRIFQNLASADDGQAIQGVNTLAGQNGNSILGGLGNLLGLPKLGNTAKPRNANIDLRPFLSVADGGTGKKMKGGVTIASPVKPVEVKPTVTKKPVRRLFRGLK